LCDLVKKVENKNNLKFTIYISSNSIENV
jgi:hypothetical protein